MLVADVQSFRILPDQHEVNVFEATALHDRIGGPDIRIKIECLPQRHVDRAKPLANGCFERALERDTCAPNGVERFIRNRIAVLRHAGLPGVLRLPRNLGACRLEDANRGTTDRRTDAVAGNQGDWSGHVGAFGSRSRDEVGEVGNKTFNDRRGK